MAVMIEVERDEAAAETASEPVRRYYTPAQWAQVRGELRSLQAQQDESSPRPLAELIEDAAQAVSPLSPTHDGTPPWGTFFDFRVWNQVAAAQDAEAARVAAERAALEARPLRRLLYVVASAGESAQSIGPRLRRAASRAIPALAPLLGGQRQAA